MTNKTDRLYQVKIKRLALLTLPTWLRRPLCAALIYAGVSPLERILNELRSFRGDVGYRLGHNGQVCKLRGVLNDEFDPKLRRIEVEDNSNSEERNDAMVWHREVGQWMIVPERAKGGKQVYREGYGGTGGYDFWVRVPSGLLNNEAESRLRAIVNMYKLASKRYAINYK